MNQTRHKHFRLAFAALPGPGLRSEPPRTLPKTFPGTEAGATSLLKEFVKPGADHAALSKQLRPTAADYAAVFDADSARKSRRFTTRPGTPGSGRRAQDRANRGQSVLATSEEMKSWTGNAAEFPGGWKDVAAETQAGPENLPLQIRRARQGSGDGV